MDTAALSADQDEVAALLADFAANVPDRLDAPTSRAAKAVLFDSLAVSMGALAHAAAQAARRHAYRFPASGGCVIWGSARRSPTACCCAATTTTISSSAGATAAIRATWWRA
jgi:2-methylcitrate dehydratase